MNAEKQVCVRVSAQGVVHVGGAADQVHKFRRQGSAVKLLPPAPQALQEWYEKEGPAMTKLLEQRVGQKGDPIPGINLDLDLV
jgi:hypothetical protein